MLVDIHLHLHFPQYDEDREDVIERAKQAGVSILVNSGTEHNTNLQVLELAKKHSIVKASLGIYPTYAEKISEKELEDELEFIKSKKDDIIAIGEIGLDFKEVADEKSIAKQKKAFKKIISTLKSLDKPFIIHSRKAELQTIEILEELKPNKVVFHCFSGGYKLAKRIEENGWSVSIPCNIEKSEHFQGVVNLLSINNLLTETDGPYLAPRGESRCEPAFIKKTIKKIAEIKKMDETEVENNIFLNYQKLFS
jgi:TatD DNase family protein